MPTSRLGLDDHPGQTYQVHDLIGDARYLWAGEANFVQLDPQSNPAHIFRIRRKSRPNAISITSSDTSWLLDFRWQNVTRGPWRGVNGTMAAQMIADQRVEDLPGQRGAAAA